jgi:5-enolpyruvylshikimate-3-phosphate synthase
MITQIHIPLESIVLTATSVTIECLNIKGRDPKVFSDLKQASAMLVAGTVGYILEPIRTRTYDIQIKQVQTGVVDAFIYAVFNNTGKSLDFDTGYHIANRCESAIIDQFIHLMPWLDNEDVFIDSYIVDLGSYSVNVSITSPDQYQPAHYV